MKTYGAGRSSPTPTVVAMLQAAATRLRAAGEEPSVAVLSRDEYRRLRNETQFTEVVQIAGFYIAVLVSVQEVV